MPDDSGQRRLGERRAETAEGFVHRRGCCCALFFRGRWNLEQSLPAMIQGKHERLLVLHNKFQNVSQTFGLAPIIEADAGTVKCGS